MNVESTPSKALREQLRAYVAGDRSIEDVARALGSAMWDIESDAILDRAALAYSEFTSGHRTESEFRSRIAEILQSRFQSATRDP